MIAPRATLSSGRCPLLCGATRSRGAARYVTVVIDLAPLRDGTGSARGPGMVPGRSKQVLKGWLAARPQAWR